MILFYLLQQFMCEYNRKRVIEICPGFAKVIVETKSTNVLTDQELAEMVQDP